MVKRSLLIWTAVIAALIGLVTQLPLSWIVGKDLRPVGTIWQGQILPIPMLGPANVTTRITRVFRGQPPVEVALTGPNLNYTVKAGLGGIKSLDFHSDFAGLPIADERLSNLRGVAEITLKDMKIKKSGCLSASGAAFTDVLAANDNTLGWSGPDLAGPVRCEGGNLLMDLAGDKDGDSVQVNLEVRPAGTYHARITARLARDDISSMLGVLGFEQSGDSYTLDEEGSWK